MRRRVASEFSFYRALNVNPIDALIVRGPLIKRLLRPLPSEIGRASVAFLRVPYGRGLLALSSLPYGREARDDVGSWIRKCNQFETGMATSISSQHELIDKGSVIMKSNLPDNPYF